MNTRLRGEEIGAAFAPRTDATHTAQEIRREIMRLEEESHAQYKREDAKAWAEHKDRVKKIYERFGADRYGQVK